MNAYNSTGYCKFYEKHTYLWFHAVLVTIIIILIRGTIFLKRWNHKKFIGKTIYLENILSVGRFHYPGEEIINVG